MSLEHAPQKQRRTRRRLPHPEDVFEPHLPLLMRVESVMSALDVSRRTVYALIAAGQLHPVRVASRITRFKTAEVLELAKADFAPLRIPGLRNHTIEERA